MTRGKIASFRKQKSRSNEENRVERKGTDGPRETDEQTASSIKIGSGGFLCTSEAGSWLEGLWDLEVGEV